MKQLKKINTEDSLAQLFLICEGLYVMTTGLLLFTMTPFSSRSEIYELLSGMMSLDAWAMVFFISGILLVVAAFQHGDLKYLSMFLGGLLGGSLLLLYGVASFDTGSNMAIGMRYTIVGVFCLAIATLGGRGLWTSRIQKK